MKEIYYTTIITRMADKNDFFEVVAEVLIELQNQREANDKNTERMINSFNTGFNAVIERVRYYEQDSARSKQSTC